MKKSELREIIKPIVKECVAESVQQMLLESGLLSMVVSEVVKGVGTKAQLQSTAPTVKTDVVAEAKAEKRQEEQISRKLEETKSKLMTAIGKDSYGGVNVFEGTSPSIPDSGPSSSALKDTDPNNPGVDITALANPNWSKLI